MSTDAPLLSEQMRARVPLLGKAKSPLGFFVLALLIVEAFLVCAGTFFNIPAEWRVPMVLIGVGLFIGMVTLVTWLVVRHPQKLVLGEASYVALEALRVYGSEDAELSAGDLAALPSSPPATSGQARLPGGAAGRQS